MFAETDVIPLFPTFVWTFDLDPKVSAKINSRILKRVEHVLPRLSTPKPDSYPYQSEPNLHEHKDFKDLAGIIVTACESLCQDMQVVHDGLDITGLWVNIAKPGEIHKQHNHPNNYFSAVYYVDIPDGAGSITFYDPRPQNGVIVPHVRSVTPSTANFATIKAVPGQLLIFPSWLQHEVGLNKGQGVRVSVATNLQFRNYNETMSRTLFSGNFKIFQ